MTEPTTSNIGLVVPNTGDLSGAWGTAALNPNFNAIDGYIGGQVTLSMTAATTITLTTASATLTPTAGPYQSANALIILSGTLTGNSIIKFTQPGRYTIWNQCNPGALPGFFIQLANVNNTGNVICAPPSQKVTVFFDGTSMDYVDMPPIATYLDMAVSTTPSWITNCTVNPWIPCLGGALSTTTYGNLFGLIGFTFGQSGNQFLAPDFQSRVMLPLDLSGAGRITAAGCGINGAAFGANGGTQGMQAHSHGVNDPGHTHAYIAPAGPAIANVVGGPNPIGASPVSLDVAGTTTNISIQIAGNGGSQNVQPAMVGGIRFIKT